MSALGDVGLRGIVFQESFGPDPRLAQENFEKLTTKIAGLRERETSLVNVGVSPHAPYTVCSPQLQMISRFALDEKLPVMMHAAETEMEVSFLREGRGPFAEGLRSRGIEWRAPGVSTIQYLYDVGVLDTRPTGALHSCGRRTSKPSSKLKRGWPTVRNQMKALPRSTVRKMKSELTLALQ